MKKKKTEFSKALLIQESALVWILTLAGIGLSYICIVNQYFGELPWLTAMVGCPWAAYAVSQACYYKKAEKENTKGGIKYESMIRAAEQVLEPEMIDKIKNLVHKFEEEDIEEEIIDDEEAVG